jgi:hypothetical protein
VKHSLLLLFLILVPLKVAFSQSDGFEIDITAEPQISNAQIIELTTLADSERRTGARLITITVANQSGADADDLYLEILRSSSRHGLLAETYQRNDTAFGLSNGQTAFISNNDIARGNLPNTRNMVFFNGVLTSSGRDFLNQLQGLTALPADEYTITANLYQRNNSRNGGILLGTASVTIGRNLIDSDFSVYLLSPGDVAGSAISISNPYPEFRWEGIPGQKYRLVVVEATGSESPQSLIESALSSSPSEQGTENPLEHVYLDVMVDGTSFQYPAFGAKSLREGRTYYWQVFSELQTTSGIAERASEIWDFRLRSGSASLDDVDLDDELKEILIPLLGEEEVNRLLRNGFALFEIELDGETYSGEAAKAQLLELLDKMRSNKIKVSD